MNSCAILSNFFEEQWTQNHPQYLSGLSRALFPTTFLEIAVNARKSWHGLEGDGPNSSSLKRGLSGFTSGHDKSILPARGFPRWLRKRKGVLFLIS